MQQVPTRFKAKHLQVEKGWQGQKASFSHPLPALQFSRDTAHTSLSWPRSLWDVSVRKIMPEMVNVCCQKLVEGICE